MCQNVIDEPGLGSAANLIQVSNCTVYQTWALADRLLSESMAEIKSRHYWEIPAALELAVNHVSHKHLCDWHMPAFTWLSLIAMSFKANTVKFKSQF